MFYILVYVYCDENNKICNDYKIYDDIKLLKDYLTCLKYKNKEYFCYSIYQGVDISDIIKRDI